ncbi:MAG: FliO/MopB family protein [Firmicutes bacterium]|nr:FliO/MopB family protein [Bacillota bacterium]
MDWGTVQTFIKNISAFLLVILLAYLTLRYGLGFFRRRFDQGVIKVVERVMLDSRRGCALYMVQIGSGFYLIGTSQGSVSLIKELPAEVIEEARNERSLNDEPTEKISFPELCKFFKKDKE